MGLDQDDLAELNLNALFQNRWMPGKKAAPNENDRPAREQNTYLNFHDNYYKPRIKILLGRLYVKLNCCERRNEKCVNYTSLIQL
ncbi:MAG: hypothetical protein K6U04_11765 [Armatimonadetes bacterium]|nr:hypothetical protein [Armatimonadota bacterium]